MHWRIDVDSDIRYYRHVVKVHDGDSSVLATFVVQAHSGDWVVLDQAGTVVHRTDRWDLAAERAIEAAASYLTYTMRSAPLEAFR